MANGDDGYAEAGGGGSVWCDFHVSEVATEPKWEGVNYDGNDHRPRKVAHDAYRLRASTPIIDKCTEHKKDDDVKGHGRLPDNHPLITGQGTGCFVIIVDTASQIERVEIDNDTLRIYLPIVQPDAGTSPRQVSLRWGLRVFDPGECVRGMWDGLKKKLLGLPDAPAIVHGVADVTQGVSTEVKSAKASARP